MIWTFCSAFIVVLYPLWESRVALTQITTGIVKVRVFPSPPLATAPLNPSLFLSFVYVLYDVQDIFSPGSGKFKGPVESSSS